MAGINFAITANPSNALQGFQQVQQGVHDMNHAIEQSGTGIDSLISKLNSVGALVGVGFGAGQMLSFVNQVKQTRSYFQDIESTMEVFLGSQEKAAAFTSKLKDYAYYNMFEFSDLAAASKQMIAYHTAAEDVIPTLDKLSNIATGTKSDLMNLVSMYNNAKSIGTLGEQQLAQWATRGVLVKETLKEMGETLKTSGNSTIVTFEQLEKVLDKVTGEGGMFHNLMLNQMENISAEVGQLEDNLANMFNTIGEKYQSYITDFIKAQSAAVDWMTENYEKFLDPVFNTIDAIRDSAPVEFLVDNFEEIGKSIVKLIGIYGVYKASLIVTHSLEKAYGAMKANIMMRELEDEIAETKKLIKVKQQERDADLNAMVAKKQLTQERADAIKKMRDERDSLSDAKKVQDIGNLADSAAGVGEGTSIDDEIAKYQSLLQVKEEIKIQDEAIRNAVASGEIPLAVGQQIEARVEELNVLKEQAAQYETNLDTQFATAEAEKASADEWLAYVQQYQEENQNILDTWEERLAAAQDETEAEQILNEALAASEEQASIAEEVNTATTEANSAAEALNAAQTEKEALAKRQSQIASQSKTVAQNVETVSTQKGMIATKASVLWDKAATVAKTALTAGINAVKNAWSALKVAFATNPFGFILTALTTLISFLPMFGNETDEVAKMSEKFGESADKAAAKVYNLYAILANTDKTSKANKDAYEELKKVAEEYGMKLSEEFEGTEKLIPQKEELIRLIKEEAVERAKANAIDTINDTYTESIEKARQGLTNALKGYTGGEGVASVLADMIPEETLQRLAELTKGMRDGTLVKNDYKKAGTEVYEIQQKLAEKAKDVAKAAGLEGYQIDGAGKAMVNYTKYVTEALFVKNANTEASIKAARKVEEEKDALVDFSNTQQSNAWVASQMKKSNDQLISSTEALIATFNAEAHLNLKVHYDDSEIPEWMKSLSEEQLRAVLVRRQTMMKLQSQHRKQTGHGYAIRGADGSWFNEERTGTEAGMAKFLLETKYSKHTNKTAPATTTPKGGKGDKWDKKQHEDAAKKAIADYDKYISDLLEEWADDSEKAAEQLKFLDPKTLSENHEKTIAEIKREGKEALSTIKDEQDKIIEEARKKEIDVWVHEAKGRKKEDAPAQKKTDEKYREELFGEGTELGKAYAQREADAKKLNEAKLLKANRDFQRQLLQENASALDEQYYKDKEYNDKRIALERAAQIAKAEMVEAQQRLINAQTPEESLAAYAEFAQKESTYYQTLRAQEAHETKYNQEKGKALNDYLKQYGTLEQKIKAVTQDYDNQLAIAVGGIKNLDDLRQQAAGDEERFIQLAVQRGASEGAIRSIIKNQAYETQELEKKMNGVKSVIDAMGEDLEKKTRKQLKAMVRDAEAVAKAIPKSSSYKQFKTITGEAGIGITEEDFDKLKNDPEELNTFLKRLEELKKASKTFLGVRPIFGEGGSFSEINFKTEEGRKAFVDMLNSIAAAADFASNSVKKLASAFGEDLGAGAEVATEAMNGALEGAQAGAAIGGPWGAAAGAALGLFSSLADSLAALHDAKHEKRIEQLADQIEVLQEQYDDLGDAVAEAFSKDASQLIAQQNKLLEQQKVLIQQQRREEEAKKKTDKDKLKDYDKQLKEIDKALEENKEKAIDAIFGEDVQSAIESFAESLTSAWENGTNSVKGARDQVKRMMRQMVQESIKAAIQSSNKIEEIRAKLQEYYADNFLSEYEQRAVMKMAEDYQRELNEQFGWSEKLFSEDYEAGNGTSGGFATMSQESADELNGRFTAMQVKMENQLAQQIIANTHLATMELSLTSQSRTLSEMRDMHVKSNEYLLSIVENTQDIVPKLNNLIQRIDVKL